MSAIGYVEYNGIELFNVSRTAQLARAMGINVVVVQPEKYAWIETALSGTDYDDVTDAPWYDPGVPESGEFGGFIPLALSGLDDDSLESSVTEYITDGGRSGKPRNATLSIVASVILVAKTERGAEFGRRWLNSVLRDTSVTRYCRGTNLKYFRYAAADAPQVHMRDVSITRGTSVTKRLENYCSTAWWVQFTLTANDPFEYGEAVLWAGWDSDLFNPHVPFGPGLDDSGSSPDQIEVTCPAPDYSPIFDPLYPALVPPPTAPNFYPDGWTVVPGAEFDRTWITTIPFEPSALGVVPIVRIFFNPLSDSDGEARMVRLSIFAYDGDEEVQCDPLFSAMVTYLPVPQTMVIDGEQKVCYITDQATLLSHRADSLVYGPNATPIEWASFAPGPLLIALDVFAQTGLIALDASVHLVPKSG